MKPIYAGQRYTAKNRRSGTVTSVYEAAAAGMDAGDDVNDAGNLKPLRWVTVCEDHSTICGHRTLKLALYHVSVPDWCEDCSAIMDEKGA